MEYPKLKGGTRKYCLSKSYWFSLEVPDGNYFYFDAEHDDLPDI